MGGLSVAAAGLGTIGGIKNYIESEQEKSDAANALKKLQRPQATNAYENTQVSTLGADLAREEQARLAANQVAGLQDMGVRGAVGGIGRVVAGNQTAMNNIAANLDEQQQKINMAKAEDEKRIQQQAQDYYQQDLSNLSSQYNAARDSSAQGFSNALLGMNAVGNGINGMNAGKAPMIGGGGGYTTSGENKALNLTNPNYMSPIEGQNNYGLPQTGYATDFNFPTYTQPTAATPNANLADPRFSSYGYGMFGSPRIPMSNYK